MRYAAGVSDHGNPESTSRGKRVLWLLVIPALALIFPGFYNRESPALFGFPFFYWYQLLWVFLATGILVIVYRFTRDSENSD
jgi:hypothetical protein